MVEISVRFTKGKRGFYILRWNDAFGNPKEKQTNVPAKDKYRNDAAIAAAEHERLLNLGPDETSKLTSWIEFCRRYPKEFLAGNGKRHLQKWQTTANRISRQIEPGYVNDITTIKLSQWIEQLRSEKLAESTIDGYCTYLLTALDWARSMGMIRRVPEIKAAKAVKRRHRKKSKGKGRAITAEEFDRVIDAVEKARPDDAEVWKWACRAFWNSGLRLSEAAILSWDWEDSFSVDLENQLYYILSDGQKSGEQETSPIAPEFVEQLSQVPIPLRTGLVFKVGVTHWTMSDIISEIGVKSRVKVSADKFVSAHDLRRSFGTKWANRGLSVYDLKELMRHRDIKTTMEYYVTQESLQLRDRIQKAYAPKTSETELPKNDSGQTVGKQESG